MNDDFIASANFYKGLSEGEKVTSNRRRTADIATIKVLVLCRDSVYSDAQTEGSV